jgi:hypothetical protein
MSGLRDILIKRFGGSTYQEVHALLTEREHLAWNAGYLAATTHDPTTATGTGNRTKDASPTGVPGDAPARPGRELPGDHRGDGVSKPGDGVLLDPPGRTAAPPEAAASGGGVAGAPPPIRGFGPPGNVSRAFGQCPNCQRSGLTRVWDSQQGIAVGLPPTHFICMTCGVAFTVDRKTEKKLPPLPETPPVNYMLDVRDGKPYCPHCGKEIPVLQPRGPEVPV